MPIRTVNLLEDKSEFEGYWWHPDDESDRVAGTLFYSREGGLRLQLMGVLNRVRPFEDSAMVMTLHGFLVEGDPVTLHKVAISPNSATRAGAQR